MAIDVDSAIDVLRVCIFSWRTSACLVAASAWCAYRRWADGWPNGSLEVSILIGLSAVLSLQLVHYLTLRRRRTLQWHEQIAVVTGAASGLGAAVARALIVRGCRVACIDVRPCQWLETMDKGATEAQTMDIQCDVSRAADVRQMAEKVRERFGDPTIVISNAGMMVGKPLLELDEGQAEQTMAVNCMAGYHCLREFVPAMLQRKEGHFVATASVMGYLGISQLGDYVASKHALIGMMESFRYELDKKYRCPGVRTTVLVLGQMRTPLFDRVRMTPLGQLLLPKQEPDVVAGDVIQALDSQQSTYIYRPYLARYAAAVQALPVWLRDAVQHVSGADESLQPS